MIGILNAHMIGTPAAPGEHVDWDVPDLASRATWEELILDTTIEEYAETNPHMIVFEVSP